MRLNWQLSLWTALALTLGAAPGRGDEIAQKGREILTRHQRAVVTVQVVLKVMGPSGKSSESRQEITGTVIDPSGLTVLALSACDPAEIYRRVSEDYKTEIEVSDIKILLDDGTELPAEIVLRDRDLDLAFIRPKTKPSAAMAAVDLSQSGSAQALDEVITLNRLNRAASRAYAASAGRISAVIQKPRTFYIPQNDTSTTTLGTPAFLVDGKVVGIFVMRAVSSVGGRSGNPRQNLTAIILPAEDVLKGAKQAPEAKPEGERKGEPGDSNEGTNAVGKK